MSTPAHFMQSEAGTVDHPPLKPLKQHKVGYERCFAKVVHALVIAYTQYESILLENRLCKRPLKNLLRRQTAGENWCA